MGGGKTREALPHEVESLVYTGMQDHAGEHVYNGSVLQEGDEVYQVKFNSALQSWTKVCLSAHSFW